MPTLQLTQVYLEPRQKKALSARATAQGVKVSELIRDAVETYLAGVTSEELTLLEAASKRAAEDLQSMVRLIDSTNAQLDGIFAQMEKLRREAGR